MTSPAASSSLAVGVVDLVAVPVPLGHRGAAVGLGHHRAGRERRPGRRPAASCRPCRRCRRRCRPGRPSSRSPGRRCRGSNSAEFASLEAGQVPRRLDDHALQAEAQAQRRDAAARGRTGSRRACPRCRGCRSRRGSRTPSTPASAAAAPAGVSQSSEATQRIVHLGAVREPAGPQRLGHRQVGVGQVDVLADQRDRDLARGWCTRSSRSPHTVQSTSRNGRSEPAHHVGVQALGVQHLRDLVDARRVRPRRRPPRRRRRTSARSCA